MLVHPRLLGPVQARHATVWTRLRRLSAGPFAAALTIALVLSEGARAQITYVDATAANTVQALSNDAGNGTASIASSGSGPLVDGGNSGNNNLWWHRTGFGINPSTTVPPTTTFTPGVSNTIIESAGNGAPENSPRLATTITFPAAGNYEIFVFYWGGGPNWNVSAGLTDSVTRLPLFGSGPITLTDTTVIPLAGPSVQIAQDNANRPLMRARVGTTGPGATSATVYIDDVPTTLMTSPGNGFRTWYDGLGYQLFFPPGDANKNGATNRLDYNLIRDNLGKTVPAGTLGDLDNNGIVNLTDFHVWKSSPQMSLIAGEVVPEPGTGVLAACTALFAGFFSRRAAKRRRAALPVACAVVATAMVATVSPTAHAQITYVDATPLNVTQSASPSGPVGAGIPWAGITDEQNAVDGQWAYRRKFGLPEGTTAPPATGSVIVFDDTVGTSTNFLMEASGPPGIEDVPRLALTVSSLPSDTYDIYAYYWVSGGQYAIRAGLTDAAGPLALLNNTTGTEIATTTATTTAQLRQVLLGQATGTSFTVYVEDLPAINAGTDRSWFDGVGYAPGILAGDVNDDGFANSADYAIIKANFFMTNATRAQGDLTGNGTVNLDDFAAWRKVVPASIAAGGSVPEPTGAILMGIGLLAARRVGRTKRRD